ncbi:tRNA (cytidine(34)-2'-O)-methyltransferase [Mycobacterium sp. 1274756.6]|uniref:tRNA (cytidine(34)-2'-O)-methyltransferase n=1 Tax=Mycobacterium sp. 1274756.6 TaxID=1834076 RepID=UPI0007FDBD9B|nr:tRNA (cytidine(34)-2'-O)-methyltransferase [Mycobacterium sp. 1274756.6]OBJ72981.1 RNA methyltransferase [Mycobacterium sp. 1274756.6]
MFKVMFYSPRIAPNTGNAIRMVAGTGAELHLVQPLGFDLSEPKLRRAGLDYHDLASVVVHESLPAAWQALTVDGVAPRVFAFTTGATTVFTEVAYRPGDVLLFGPEPTGLDAETLADPHITERLRIPMLPGRRSLNLSNAAAVAAYEAWRQHRFPGAV